MEIKFKRDTSFRKQFFVPDSFAHPAKMDAQLLLWVVNKYSEAGETILDPMAGSGTTMLACTLGRNCILVELEEKFCKMMRDNWEQVKMKPQLGSTMGECQIIQGDARQLEGLLVRYDAGSSRDSEYPLNGQLNQPVIQFDKIVTSPPYAEADQHKESIRDGLKRDHPNLYLYSKDQAGNSKNNIGNLPYGEIDKCIFSPPYAETGVGDWQTGRAEFQAWVLSELETKGYIEWQGKRYTESEWRAMNHGRIDGRTTKGVHKHPTEGYGATEGQIGQLPYGQIDKIVTSPPYGNPRDIEEQSEREYEDKRLGETDKQHGRTQFRGRYEVDSIITSPPYQAFGASREGEKIRTGQSEIHQTKSLPTTYTNKQTENIGNKQGQSYLEAMLQVYQQCHKVLKPQGLMILVTKNFIRNKQVVRLDTDTIKLCGQAGFSFVERHYRELPSQSFWRVIYAKKFPDVEQIKSEDVLVFRAMK